MTRRARGILHQRHGRTPDTISRIGGSSLTHWGRYADAIARWERITGRAAPAPALIHESGSPRPAPGFLEWLMGLETGWVADAAMGLTPNQQMAALGNGVLPLQAVQALRFLVSSSS